MYFIILYCGRASLKRVIIFNNLIFKKIFGVKKIKKHTGETLIEILAAMTIISIILPSLFYLPSGILKSVIALRRNDTCCWGAQFWFSRLPDFKLINESAIRAMPDSTPDGSVKFNLRECTAQADGTIKIVLEIQNVKYDVNAQHTMVVTRYI